MPANSRGPWLGSLDRWAWLFVLPLLGSVSAASAQTPPCRAHVVVSHTSSSSSGLEFIQARSAAVDVEIHLVRVPARRWTLRVRDMRDLRQSRALNGDYTSPTHSLAELELLAPSRILSSAGMTDSLFAPVPVGLLKANGVVRNKANLSSRNLDGVLCARKDGGVEILSRLTPAGRRIPPDIDAATSICTDAVQTGPMLIEAGETLVTARRQLNVPRVFAAVGRDRRFVLGYSPRATTYDLACTLADESLQIAVAVHLQSDALGGVLFGNDVGLAERRWGNIDATLASALEIGPTLAAAREIGSRR